jgi:hypothetical protein
MDGVREFLENLRQNGVGPGNFLGLLHVIIGRRITKPDGTVVSAGLTWREAAAVLKQIRWEREAVAELGLNPDDLPPRDRQRFWYSAIAGAGVDSPEARSGADQIAKQAAKLGYVVGKSPG